jgi:hypothetical protein
MLIRIHYSMIRLILIQVPNPFMGQGKGPTPGHGFPDGENEELLLADGALAQESMPLFPFLQPSRMVDVIMAVDSVSSNLIHDLRPLITLLV